MNLLKGITKIDSNLVQHSVGIWDNNGDIDPLDDLKNNKFKDYSGFTWNGYVSIKKEDSYKLGLLPKKDYYEYSKSIVSKLIMDSGFDINNVKWYACLHLDSKKNYNFHFFFMEVNKTKFKYSERLIPKSAIKKFKSNALNYLINRDEILKLKDELFMGVIKDIKINNLTKLQQEKTFKSNIEKKLSKLYKQLSKEHRLQYNSPNLNKVRPLIDSIIIDILNNSNVVDSYYKYIEKLHDIDFQNKEYYGYSKENNYIDNQIKKLYSKIGNDILNEYKGYKTEIFLNNQKEFLSKNIFKLNLKTNNNITDDKKIELGVSLYKIANYNNLSTFQTKRLIKNWYIKSKFDDDFEGYYNTILLKISDSKSLNTTEFYKTLNDMNISNSNYHKLKQEYYTKKYVYNRMMWNALEHIKYENERIEKEIVESMSNELEY